MTNTKYFVANIDISKYTALMRDDQEKGLNAKNLLATIAQKVLDIGAGEYIKSIGDAVLLIFEDVNNAIDATRLIHCRWQYAKKTIGVDNDLHSCITYGEIEYVSTPTKDINGSPVNQTNRVSKCTPPGKIYLSEEVKLHFVNDENYSYEDSGEYDLAEFGKQHLYSVLYKRGEINTIVDKVIEAFHGLRKMLLKDVVTTTAREDLSRLGDQHPMTDDDVAERFEKVLEGYKIFYVSEHRKVRELDELKKYKYVCILDPIDGSVNSMHGLPFGTNFAIGKIRGEAFTIRDIEAVLVVDYKSGICHKWIFGNPAELILNP